MDAECNHGSSIIAGNKDGIGIVRVPLDAELETGNPFGQAHAISGRLAARSENGDRNGPQCRADKI